MQPREKAFEKPKLHAADNPETAYFYANRYANGAIVVHVEGLSAVPDNAAVLTWARSRGVVGHCLRLRSIPRNSSTSASASL